MIVRRRDGRERREEESSDPMKGGSDDRDRRRKRLPTLQETYPMPCHHCLWTASDPTHPGPGTRVGRILGG